jgi:hypothetical protein
MILFSWLCLVYQSSEPNKDFPMTDETSNRQARDISHLPEAAQRALAEAEERRIKRDADLAAMPLELGGREGPEPVRYGDYEKKGIAVDF